MKINIMLAASELGILAVIIRKSAFDSKDFIELVKMCEIFYNLV